MQSKSIKNSKQGNVVVIILLLLVVMAGAGYYFYTQMSGESYAAQTEQLATQTSRAVLQLDDRSTIADLARVRSQINAYLSRSDAVTDAQAGWNEQLEKIEATIAARETRFAKMKAQIEAFDPNSNLAQLETFDAELKAFTQTLDTRSKNELLVQWSKLKNQITVDIQSVSATIVAKTFPSGAKTYLDGEYLGLSSLGIQNIRRGTHTLKFEKDGYLPAEYTFEVTRSEKIEPEPIELPLATQPLRIRVAGGKARAMISVSIEKTADDNRDIILYIDEKEGRDVTFDQAPIGTLLISVTADNRLATETTFQNSSGETALLELKLD